MIDVYIDDIKIKTLGYDGDKNQLAIENGENKAMLIFDDNVLYQLYILLKNRGEMKGLIPIYNKLEPITVKIANDTDVAEIVHGKWVYNTDDFTPKYRCSVCGYNKPIVSGENITQEPKNYCPNCGAKMDKE